MNTLRCMKGLCKLCPEVNSCNGMRKESKYHNQKVSVDGIIFDSKKEANRYKELKLLELTGKIKRLQRQVSFELIPAFSLDGKRYRPLNYIADFVYEEGNKQVVEDVKGIRTDVYKLKKKFMAYKYKIEIREVY